MAPTKPKGLASLISKIHPPLPLNPRESQQLKKALSKSFQDQLDREHPISNAGIRGHSDAHVSSILANPHFGLKRRSSTEPSRSRRESTSARTGTLEHLQTFLLQKEADSQLERFRSQIARGEANLTSAKTCLKAYKDCGYLFDSVTERAALEQEMPGRVMANWLWSTGLEESLEFIHDHEFTKLLIHSLFLEGQSKRVRTWVEKAFASLEANREAGLVAEDTIKAASNLLFSFISTTRKHSGLVEAVATFDKEVCQLHDSELARAVANTTVRSLSQDIMHSPHTCNMDVALFEKFQEALPSYLNGRHLQYRVAWMDLVHPQKPNPDAAVKFLKNASHSFLQSGNPSRQQAAMRSHRKVAEVLTSLGRDDEAEEILQLMKDTLPPVPQPTEHVHQSMREVQRFQMLKELPLGSFAG